MRRPSRHASAVASAVTVAALVAPVAATSPASAATAHPRRIVSGWLPYWQMSQAFSVSTHNADLIHAAMPFWYGATGVRTIEGNAGAGDRTIVRGLRQAGIKVVPTVTDSVSTATMVRIMTRKSLRAAHRHRLVRLVLDNGYQGINIDYESMAWHVSSRRQATALRNGFTTFVHGLARALHRHHRMLSIAVIARTAASTGLAGSVFDYHGLGEAVNRFQVMTYDYHWSGGSPGPVAPIDWQRRVMAYATGQVWHHKVELGIPSYGYDWGRAGTTASSVTYREARAIASRHGRAIQWSDSTKSPYFAYRSHGVRHEVWFTNARAVRARLGLITRFRLGGIAEWAFGDEDPKQWSRIRTFASSL